MIQPLNKAGAFTLLGIACLTIMVGCVLAPGLPMIAAGLHVDSGASWLMTLPSLGAVLCAPVAGRLIERYGPYRTLCAGLFLYGLLGLACIFLQGWVPVSIDRLALGGVTVAVMAAGTALISVFYQGPARLRMIARQGMAIELGGVIFLFIGGLLASAGWRYPFILYLTSWICLAMLVAFVPADAARPTETVDEAPHGSGKIVDVCGAALLSMIVFFVAVIVLPLRLHSLYYSAAQTGYLLSFVSLIAVGAASLMPWLTRSIGEHGVLIAAFICYTLSHILFVGAALIGLFVPAAILLGTGFGLSIPLANHMVIERSHPQHRGRNLAALSMAIFLGQFLASFVVFVPGGDSHAFIVAAMLAALSAGCIGGAAMARRKVV